MEWWPSNPRCNNSRRNMVYILLKKAQEKLFKTIGFSRAITNISSSHRKMGQFLQQWSSRPRSNKTNSGELKHTKFHNKWHEHRRKILPSNILLWINLEPIRFYSTNSFKKETKSKTRQTNRNIFYVVFIYKILYRKPKNRLFNVR